MFKVLGWLATNWVSIQIAQLLALAVWIVATLEENPIEEADLSAPVTIDVINLSPGLIITNDYTSAARVRLRAQRSTWGSISPADVVVTADLTGLGPGIHQVALVERIDAQADLVFLNPSHIRIELEERGEREMPIQLKVAGRPATGYQAGDPTLTPRLVTVSGPRSKVDLVSEVRAALSIEAARETIAGDFPLEALDSSGSLIEDVTLTPNTVSASISITQEAGYRDISVLVRTVGRPAPGYYVTSILPTPQRITVQGDPALIEAMQPYAETETIDLTNLTDDLFVEVRLDLPPGVTPIGSQTVEVLISIAAQISSRTVLDVPVQAVGLGEGLAVEFSPPEIDVILTGPLTVLDALDPATDILVTVDLTGLLPGIYQIAPQVEVLKADILVESILPILIEIKITTGAPDS